ncbi:MAG: hypothetical protein FIA99_05495 [Ruminiclostridium sp.]|nr:hypothetical protein [Ruminiclostridium sp.]
MNKKVVPDRNIIESAYCSVVQDIETKSLHSIIMESAKKLNCIKKPYKDNLYSARPHLPFNITVTEQTKDRALASANLFIRVIEKIGYKTIKGSSMIRINGITIGIQLKEFFQQTEHIPASEEKRKASTDRYYNIPQYDLIPSGELAFIIRAQWMPDKIFRDKPKVKIESQIVDVISWIFGVPEKIEYNREQKRLDEEEYRQSENRRIEREFIEHEEMKKFQRLKTEADDFDMAMKILEYAQALESRILTIKMPINRKSEIRKLIKWAKDKADWLNPVIAKEDPILGKRHIKKV